MCRFESCQAFVLWDVSSNWLGRVYPCENFDRSGREAIGDPCHEGYRILIARCRFKSDRIPRDR